MNDLKCYFENYFSECRKLTNYFFDSLFEIKMVFLGLDSYCSLTMPREFTKKVIWLVEDAIKEYKSELEKEFKASSLKKLLYFSEQYMYELHEISLDPLLKKKKTAKRIKLFGKKLGIYLYITKELQERLLKATRAEDGSTFSKPFAYVAFELLNRISKSGYFDVSEEAKELLDAFKKDAEIITKGLYLPDDTDWSEKNKFISSGKESKTEAEGLFDDVLTEFLGTNFSNIDSIDELVAKMYEWDEALAYFPKRFRSRVCGKIKLDLAQLEAVEKLEKVEYCIKDPERTSIIAERRETICFELRTWSGKQPKQAHLAREVVEYVIRAVTDPASDSEEAFKVTKIAEALNSNRKTNTKTTSKEVRNVLNKIKEEVPILEFLLD